MNGTRATETGSGSAAEPVTATELRRLLGDVEEGQLAEILAVRATVEEVEVAIAWAADESDVMGSARKPLSGRAATVYEILRTGDALDAPN